MIQRLLPLLAILPLLGQAGPVYKWVDEKGVVHFSSRHHHEAEDVETLEVTESPRISTVSVDEDKKANDHSTEVTEEVTGNNSLSSEQIEYCKVLKSNLSTLKSNSRVRMKNDNGEFDILAGESLKAEMTRIETAIKKSCS